MRIATLLLVSLSTLALAPAATAVDPPLRGFSNEGSRTEREWEAKFRAMPEPARMRSAMERLAARPHHVGSPYDKANAEWLRAQFESYGWDARIETFDVLFPTPKERLVELVAPTRFTATLQEPAEKDDPTSGQRDEQLPTYNAYSGDGDVTAPLVYVNYGVPADYEELALRGVSVKGAIVIARYGGSWRGIKPKVAAEHGAVGCLIYSDPRDDGFGSGDVFPAGPMRNSTGVQRGSVADMPLYPGDPLTPGVGAVKGAKRLALKDAKTITTIPVLPISYGDAQPLLSALRGPLAPPAWRGGLAITYRLGPGAARVHLKVKSNWDIKPLYDVIARLTGSEAPDEWIIRGNHHDAWVNGAQDPISGLVPELEEARAMGEMVKQGWRPKRTLIYAAWDGEEPGLLGSTEWVEAHGDELAKHAVAYINSDVNARGFLDMAGSHTLEKFINGVARDIDDPQAKVTAWTRAQHAAIRWGSPDARRKARERADLPIGALGSGSDFTPFLQHAGVASLNIGFGGEDDGGIYHSIYDDFYWFTHFSDTSFVYGRALAQTIGTAVMRLASAEVLPLAFTNLAETVHDYVKELRAARDEMADRVTERNRELDEGTFAMTDDPRFPLLPPERLVVPPHLNFAPVEDAADALSAAAARYESALAKSQDRLGDPAARASLTAVNARLMQSERTMTSAEGLPGRSWFKHLLYAPGFYTGYGVKTMPGVREGIEQKQWKQVETEMPRIAAVLQAEASLVGAAADALEALSK